MGTPETAVPTLRRCLEDGHEVAAVWTQPDRPAGRGRSLHQPPVKEFVLANGLLVHQPLKIRTEEALAAFAGAATPCDSKNLVQGKFGVSLSASAGVRSQEWRGSMCMPGAIPREPGRIVR